MKTWDDFMDWITKATPKIQVSLTLPEDFPLDNKYHTVSITCDQVEFVGSRGRTKFFSGKLKLEPDKQ